MENKTNSTESGLYVNDKKWTCPCGKDASVFECCSEECRKRYNHFIISDDAVFAQDSEMINFMKEKEMESISKIVWTMFIFTILIFVSIITLICVLYVKVKSKELNSAHQSAGYVMTVISKT